jgi:uncharacterized phage protein (TIGR01671 family)
MENNLDRFLFKVFNHDTNKIEDGSFFICNETGNLYEPIIDWDLHIEAVDFKFTILQSTGLKDKNGTIIFEGDVLKIPTGYGFGNIKNVVVAWEDGCFGFQGINFSEFKTDTEIELFEIIGNRFQNPELLEKQ